MLRDFAATLFQREIDYRMIGFETLRERLLNKIRTKIRNGEVTERALARTVGISQPHMHNLLKGFRALTPDAADQILTSLRLTALDLLEEGELRHGLMQVHREVQPHREVAVLSDPLGPGLPWPERVSPLEKISVPYPALARFGAPLAVRLGHDPEMRDILPAGSFALLDTSAQARTTRDPEALFAIERNGNCVLRWIRRGRSATYLLSAERRNRPDRWESIGEGECGWSIRARAVPLSSIVSGVLEPTLQLPGTRPEHVPR